MGELTVRNKNGVSMLSYYENSIRKMLLGMVLIILFYTFTAAIITSLDGKLKISSHSIKTATNQIHSSWYVSFLSLQNPYFGILLEKDERNESLIEVMIKVITSLTPSDPRTFLGNEIPGLFAYHNEIIVAREGSNLGNLPIELEPTEEELANEGEAKDEENQEESPKENIPPIQTTNGKKVLYIYHTHNRESYFPMLKEGSKSASHSEANITYVGKHLGKALQNRGIGVEVDTTDYTEVILSRKLKYADSYDVSKEQAEKDLKKNPDLKYIFDLHRDTREKEDTTVVINGKPYAKLYFIVGTENKTYKKNREIAEQFEKLVHKKYKGISRGVHGQGGPGYNGVYNQDLSTNALTIEYGGMYNTVEEINNTIEALADVFTEFYWQKEGKN